MPSPLQEMRLFLRKQIAYICLTLLLALAVSENVTVETFMSLTSTPATKYLRNILEYFCHKCGNADNNLQTEDKLSWLDLCRYIRFLVFT